MIISFKINTDPVAQPRQRHRIMGSGKMARVINYTPENDPVNAFKKAVQIEAKGAYKGPLLDEPLILRLVEVFERPKYLIYKNKPMPRIPKTSKPDFDNLAKSVCDALNGVLYRDDSLIYAATVIKWIAAGGESPSVSITIST